MIQKHILTIADGIHTLLISSKTLKRTLQYIAVQYGINQLLGWYYYNSVIGKFSNCILQHGIWHLRPECSAH